MKLRTPTSGLSRASIAPLALLLLLFQVTLNGCSPLYDYETIIELSDDDRLSLPNLSSDNGSAHANPANSTTSNSARSSKNNNLRSNNDIINDNNGNHALRSEESVKVVNQQSNNKPNTNQAKIDKRQQQQTDSDEYLIGLGLADITGPAADVNLMGYAKPSQDASGIHLRQFSRAVVAVDKDGNRLVYASLDNGMIGTLLRSRILAQLAQEFGSSLYNETNVMMSATHTHSGPGGFFQYMLYNIPSAGFVSQTMEVLVSGTVESIRRAHHNLKPARVYYTGGELLGASVNRSPLSYQLNPADERKKYAHDTDKTMHLLRFVDTSNNKTMGVLNWFAVHGTSMNNTNHLISSDNKGTAAIFLEQDFNPAGTMPGQNRDFIAIFAQANEGDVSPNTAGPRCIDTGLPCDPISSTCGNPPKNELCIAFGPGKDMFESTKIIGHHQYMKARELMLDESHQVPVRGPIKVVHEHIDMTKQQVPKYKQAVMLAERLANYSDFLLNDTYHTCEAALGYSFAAGTTDGPGAFDFRQGRTQGHSYWNVVRDLLRRPSAQQVECHRPKPILLDTGEMDFPYTWHPRVVPTQLFRWGQLAIVALPGEFTTMAGRRIRAAVESELPNHEVILSGLSNIYTSYVSTLEEYALQRYEGASTLYGPHTLQAYVNQFTKLSSHLNRGIPIISDLSPPDLSKSLFSLRPGVIYDGTPRGRRFGDTLRDVEPSYQCGQVVNVSFVSANPRNDPRSGDEETFLKVERFLDQGLNDNVTVATDASWETKFIWQRTNTLKGSSRATIIWEIPHNCTPGHYIIRHFGASKNWLSDTTKQFLGVSSVFELKQQQVHQ